MDNTRDLPGYKHYLDPETGERPAIYVAYLDLAPDDTSTTGGVVFALDGPSLTRLDSRERNYERTEVTGSIDPPPNGRVWAYVGTAAARERFARGLAEGTAVVDRAYYEAVLDGVERVGASMEPPPVPIRPLTRIDAPLAKAP